MSEQGSSATTTGQDTRDPLAVLERIRAFGYLPDKNGAAAFAQSDQAARDIPVLLAGYDALLKAHKPDQIYKSADNCDHECPSEPDWRNRPPEGTAGWAAWEAAAAAWDAYQDDHPIGSGPDGGTGEGVRVCLLSPDYMACPACTKLVYQTWGDEDRFISAAECVALPLIAAALSGEETPAS